MTKLLQQALDALIESRDDVDLCYAGVKAARLSFRQERQLGFYEEQLVKHDAAIEGLKQALAQQEQCGCREGECETKKDKTCRMTIEIAERDGIPEWTPAIGIECAISSLRDDAARLRDGSYMRIQIADDLDVIANDLAKCKSLTQQEQPASVDAYVGAREDAAIWKKRALEAEELNRQFIAELNGPTYLGEPAQQEQPAQEPVETVTLVGIKDGVETVLGTVSTPPEMKAREIIRNYGWNPDDQGDLSEGETAMCIVNDLLAWMKRQGSPKIELATPPTQPVLSEEVVRAGFRQTDGYAEFKGMTSWQVWRAAVAWVEAHCRGGANK